MLVIIARMDMLAQRLFEHSSIQPVCCYCQLRELMAHGVMARALGVVMVQHMCALFVACNRGYVVVCTAHQ
jgi:hypothetical protein